jgi:hypothetical protein
MAWILTVLIVALLNGVLIYIDGMLEGIVPIALYAEKYMELESGISLITTLTNLMFAFGVSVIILKFLKKGFETYILWTEGDADEEPLSLLTNFFKAMAVAIMFPTLYGWLASIVQDLTSQMITAIGEATAMGFEGWVNAISGMGLVTAIFGLIFVITFFLLYFQFLMRGLEIMILRIGVPLACVGLLDNDKGVFKAYSTKFFQSMLSVLVQICLAKLGVGLMLNMHVFWGVACMALAIKTPKFLNEFIVSTGSGGGGAVNNVYHTVRLVSMAGKAIGGGGS